MSHAWGRYTLALLLAGSCWIGVAQQFGTAQEASGRPMVKSSAGGESTGASKPTRRLPRYFGSIVDQQQRLEIYQIQAGYQEQIAELEQTLAELESAQMQEIEAVLTDSQYEQLVAKREQAANSRKRSSAAPGPQEDSAAAAERPAASGRAARTVSSRSRTR